MTDPFADWTDAMSADALSSNHYSVDGQLDDVIHYLDACRPTIYAAMVAAFPEVPTRAMGDTMSAEYDTNAMGVDVEWSCWLIDWIEQNSNVIWEEGEPWLWVHAAGHPLADWPASAHCPECERVFNLACETDADEWLSGHDCWVDDQEDK